MNIMNVFYHSCPIVLFPAEDHPSGSTPPPAFYVTLACITSKLKNCIPLFIMMKYIRQHCSSVLPIWYFPPRALCPLSRLAAQPVLRTSGHHHPGNSRCLSSALDALFPLSWVIMSCWWSTSSRNFLKKKQKGNLLRSCMP